MKEIVIIADTISLNELKKLAQEAYGNLIKAVVDVEKEVIAVGGELHSDEEARLLEDGSRQENLWGINFYPELTGADFIEFDSMINVRPAQNNMSRGVDDENIRKRIAEIVGKRIER